jgi:hypothetical protein
VTALVANGRSTSRLWNTSQEPLLSAPINARATPLDTGRMCGVSPGGRSPAASRWTIADRSASGRSPVSSLRSSRM